LAIPLGVVCGANRNNAIDRGIQLSLFTLYSIPAFVAGMMFLMFFAYGGYFKYFPATGIHSPGAENFTHIQYALDYAWHMVLPTICLSLFSLAQIAMYARASMIDALGQDYIRTARSVGVSNFTVIGKHALRNSLIPVITLFASLIPAMLGGSVLIEVLFGIPGMGRLSWNAIVNKDIPTLMANVYIDAILVMLSILLTDILYTVVDPRISFGGQERS
jgi:peptide/nickel transport system permease protein